MLPKNTYVLATKYADGDPQDHWYVGFVIGYTHHGRYLNGDNEYQSQRANGFRRAEAITKEEGDALLALECFGTSMWKHLQEIRDAHNI